MKRYTVYDYEYKRCGVRNMYLACEPLAGKQMVNITERKTSKIGPIFWKNRTST